MSYPKTPNNMGEYVNDDGTVGISSERRERLIDAIAIRVRSVESGVFTLKDTIAAALDVEFTVTNPKPRLEIGEQNYETIKKLLADTAFGAPKLRPTGNQTYVEAADVALRRLFEVIVS